MGFLVDEFCVIPPDDVIGESHMFIDWGLELFIAGGFPLSPGARVFDNFVRFRSVFTQPGAKESTTFTYVGF